MMVGDRDDYVRVVNCINTLASTWCDAAANLPDENQEEFFIAMHEQLLFLHRGFNNMMMQHG